MSSVNLAILMGHVGNEPTTKTFQNGDSVTNFSLATSDSWKDKATGEQKSVTEWHNIVAYRKLGEIAARLIKKGSHVHVHGSIKTRQWDKDGVKHYKTEIEINKLIMLDKKTGEIVQSASGEDTDLPF